LRLQSRYVRWLSDAAAQVFLSVENGKNDENALKIRGNMSKREVWGNFLGHMKTAQQFRRLPGHWSPLQEIPDTPYHGAATRVPETVSSPSAIFVGQ